MTTTRQTIAALDAADQAPSKRQRGKMRDEAVRARLVSVAGSEAAADAILSEFAVTHKADLHTHAGRKDRHGWLDVQKRQREAREAKIAKAEAKEEEQKAA